MYQNTTPRPLLEMLATCVLLLVFSTGSAEARQIRMDVETMKEASEAIVLAKTVRTQSYWNDERTAILTRVTLSVSDRLTGEAETETEIIVPGGRVGDYVHEVSDMPSFVPEEESIVFIERHPTGSFIVTGGAAGKLDVDTDPVTGQKTVPGVLFSGETRTVQAAGKDGTTEPPPSRMTLEELKEKLRQ